MVYLVAYIFISAIWHFVYEGIIAPGARLHIRNDLFSLRDELRNLKIEKKISKDDEKVFEFVHTGINLFLKKLPELSMTANLNAKKEIAGNESLKKQLDTRVTLVDTCNNAELKDIFQRSCKTVMKAFIVNSGSLIIYVIPVFICLVFFNSFKRLVSELFVAPPVVSNKLLPDSSINHAIA